MCGRGEKEDWDADIISRHRRASATAATLASTDDAMEQVKVHPLSLSPCLDTAKINNYVRLANKNQSVCAHVLIFCAIMCLPSRMGSINPQITLHTYA